MCSTSWGCRSQLGIVAADIEPDQESGQRDPERASALEWLAGETFAFLIPFLNCFFQTAHGAAWPCSTSPVSYVYRDRMFFVLLESFLFLFLAYLP